MSQIKNELTCSSQNFFEKSDDSIHRLQVKRDEASTYIQSNTQEAKNLARKVSLDVMAQEWLKFMNDKNIDTIVYLIENFLPILILGCERVLNEADRKQLVEQNKSDLNFNPINNLAQFLMRNNPKYNNHNELSPYVRSMRQVFHEMREYLLMSSDKKSELAQIKTEIRVRRDEREKQEVLKRAEKTRRQTEIANLFQHLHLSDRSRLELGLLDITIKICSNEITFEKANINIDKFPSFCFVNEKLNLDKRLMKHEFDQSILSITQDLKSEYFDYFIELVKHTGEHFIGLANKKILNKILTQLFDLIDLTKTGLLTRKKVQELLEKYYATCLISGLECRKPSKWPVTDPFIKCEQELQMNQKKQVTHDGDSNAQVPQDLNDTNSNSNVKIDDSSAEVHIHSEALESTENQMNAIEEQAASVNKMSVEENFDAIPNQNSLRHIQVDEGEEERARMKHNEILFIKDGLMYYRPLSNPIDSFDRQMIQVEFVNETINNLSFDFINAKQFLSLINNFLSKISYYSESNINALINCIKDNYAESVAERSAKIRYIENLKEKLANEEKLIKLFDKLDNEGSNHLSLEMVSEILGKFKDGMYKDVIVLKSQELKEEILCTLKNKDVDLNLNKMEFIRFFTKIIHELNSPIFAEQLMSFLSNSPYFDYPTRVRGENRRMWLKDLESIGKTSLSGFDDLYKQLERHNLLQQKDAEHHSDGKNISAYVGLLEKMSSNEIGLKYHAATSYDSKFVLNKSLTRKQTCVSFEVIDSGQMMHIQRVRQNPQVHYFDRNCDKDGSFLIIPLKCNRNQVYGVLGIDTLQESSNKFFNETDLAFYNGVATIFAKSYADIIMKNRLLKVCLSSITWLTKRCPFIHDLNIYFMNKPNIDAILIDKPSYGFTLQPIYNHLTKSTSPPAIAYIKEHIYECAASGETTIGYFNNETSYCYALKNEDHKSLFVFEVICEYDDDDGSDNLSEIENVLYVLHKCQEALLTENLFGQTKNIFKFEETHAYDKHEILFEKEFYKYTLDKLALLEGTNLVSFEPREVTPSSLKDLISLIAYLIKYDEFEAQRTIDRPFLNKLKDLDPTERTFKFDERRAINLSNEKAFEELDRIQMKLRILKEDNQTQATSALIDYLCLIESLNRKTLNFY